MINIISRSLIFKSISGPGKVVRSLIKGLDLIGYPYVINKRLDACRRLYIHDDKKAFEKALNLPAEIKIIAGPNIYTFPRDIPSGLDLSRIVYLNPSKWGKSFWERFGFNHGILEAWPTGIDTYKFKPSGEKKIFVLLYFKQRFEDELKQVVSVLHKKQLDYKILNYDKGYKEEEYKALLAKSRYVVWLGRQETQGIALEEALATDTPVLVCDVNAVGHCTGGEDLTEEESRYTNTTSAPYFDDLCGIKIKDLSELESAIDSIEKNLKKFSPRKYVLENLSLEKQAKDLVELFDKHFDLSYGSGLREKLIRRGNWLNKKPHYVFYLRIKHTLKMTLVKLGLWKRIYLLLRGK